MYYIKDYYRDEIITCTDDLRLALSMAKNFSDAVVTDENDNIMYYCNLDIPF